MRNAFTKKLCEAALINKDILIITNDAPTPAFTEFRKKAPRQFFNAGLAEAHMTGMAAGLALSGKTVITYSIVPFVTIRCLEQIRNDVCYQNVNVKIIGIGGGLCYASLGSTHVSLEDVALLRAIPNLVVISPADPIEAEGVVKEILEYKGPVYVRLGRAGEPNLYKNNYKFKIGKASVIKKGGDVVIFGYGPVLERALRAAEDLKNEGVEVEVVNVSTLKPVDERAIVQAIRKTRAVVTIEEHSIIGGLSSIVAEIIAKHCLLVPFVPIALEDKFPVIYGKQTDLMEILGFSKDNIKKIIKNVYQQKIKYEKSDEM